MPIEDPRHISGRTQDSETQHAPKLRAGDSVARNRLGAGADNTPIQAVGIPSDPASAFEGFPPLSDIDETSLEESPLLKGLSSLFGSAAEATAEAPPTLSSLVSSLKPLDNVVLSQPQMAGALALGGVIAGCAMGALALGLGGALITFAFEAIAFAGGVLVSRAGQKQLLEVTEKLLFDATHDGMTGLLNRKAIMEGLDEVADRGRKTRQHFAILLTDVDHFKKINDTYGHQAGDEVLKAVAGRLRETVRQATQSGRYGGEEFLVVMPETRSEMAFAAAERVRKSMANDPVVTAYGTINVTVSIGVASSDRAGDDTSRLLRAADEALYRAKNNGRNRVEVALQPAS